MTKKDRIEEIVNTPPVDNEVGKTKEELEAMSAKDVEKLFNELFPTEEGMKVGDVSAIISKRHDKKVFWLENGTIVKFKDCEPQSKKPGQSPLYRAKDYCKKTETGYELIKKADYVEEKKEKEVE